MNDLIEELSDFLVNTSYDDLSSSLVNKAKNSIIDSHAVILAGYDDDVSNITKDWVIEQSGAPQSTVLAYNIKSTVSLSAFMHGIMGHSLDYDDVFPPLRGHPSMLVYSSILSVAEYENKSGKDIILSFLLGTEVMSKIGMNLNPSHYLKGWHSTSTVGVIGSAVAVGKLYNFNKTQFKTILGLVSSLMSGTRRNFGTMTKSLHVGNASRAGVEAAQLVKKGFSASHNTYNNPGGVFELYSDENPKGSWEGIFGNPWSIVEPGFHTKKYPCCYATHRFIDGINDIFSNNEIDFDTIEEIECIGPVGSFAPLLNYFPTTGLEGKFSLEYVVATMIIEKEINLNSFKDEKVKRKNINKVMRKVKIKESNSIKEDRGKGINGFVMINVFYADNVIKKKVFNGKGSAKRPLSDNELKNKFFDCTKTMYTDNDSEKNYKMLKNLENVNNVSELFVN